MIKYLFVFLFSFSFAQQTQFVDFKSVLGKIAIDPIQKSVIGEVNYDFEVLKSIDTIAIDAQNMTISDLKINNKAVPFKVTTKQILLFKGFKKGKNKLYFKYVALPKQTIYFVGKFESAQVWTQGQGKYTSHWFPSFDDVNEKVIFNLDITFDSNYQVIANGILESKVVINNLTLWQYRMQKPMSSYLLMLAIGNFDWQQQKSKSGIPLVMYYQRKDFAKFEPTYRYSKLIFDFLEKKIGFLYPWEIYKQIPVQDFLYAGMENTSATVFSQDFVVDSVGFNDRNYINVNAHELAHQWFGDVITAKTGKDHWLQEGFATYYALLAEKEIFGDNYFNWKMYEMAERLQKAVKTDTVPILNEKASSLTFYQKGAWALHILHEGVGAVNFDKAVAYYLKKHAFKNVTTVDFLASINKFSDYDTTSFRKKWLEQSGFEVNEAIALLKKNTFIQDYFNLLLLQETPFVQKEQILKNILQSEAYYPIREEVVFQLKAVPFKEKKALLRLALNTKNIVVRQAVSTVLDTIPVDFYDDYKSLLGDDSYITKEIVMNKLWAQFPDKRKELLLESKDFVGFNDQNLRILWLSLALLTKDFETENKSNYYDFLLDFTTEKYESAIRQNAISNLLYIDANDTNALEALAKTLSHHKWQFTKFGRDKIRSLLKKEKYKTFYIDLLPKLSVTEQVQLNKLLQE